MDGVNLFLKILMFLITTLHDFLIHFFTFWLSLSNLCGKLKIKCFSFNCTLLQYQYTNDTYPVIVFIHGGRFQTGSGSDIPQRAILSNFVSRKASDLFFFLFLSLDFSFAFCFSQRCLLFPISFLYAKFDGIIYGASNRESIVVNSASL